LPKRMLAKKFDLVHYTIFTREGGVCTWE